MHINIFVLSLVKQKRNNMENDLERIRLYLKQKAVQGDTQAAKMMLLLEIQIEKLKQIKISIS